MLVHNNDLKGNPVDLEINLSDLGIKLGNPGINPRRPGDKPDIPVLPQAELGLITVVNGFGARTKDARLIDARLIDARTKGCADGRSLAFPFTLLSIDARFIDARTALPGVCRLLI